MQRHEKNWSEQWWMMAKSEAVQYQIIKGLEVCEFFRLLDVYLRDLKRKINE